jgi:hypothetical protein
VSIGISPLADIAALGMTQQVKIKPYLGTTGSGGRLYDTERTYPCRTQEDNTPIFTATGQQVVSKATIEVYPRATDGTVLVAINVDSFITLPDGTSPRILHAGAVYDLAGGTIKWRVLT